MISDNLWHHGFLYKRQNGNFNLACTEQEMLSDELAQSEPDGSVHMAEVIYNWNNGQPIIDLGDFKVSIVDGSTMLVINEKEPR